MDKKWNVNEFKHRELQAVQAAVDACARAGGGVVAVSEGDWFSGAIYNYYPLIYAKDCIDIAAAGKGVLEGNGAAVGI